MTEEQLIELKSEIRLLQSKLDLQAKLGENDALLFISAAADELYKVCLSKDFMENPNFGRFLRCLGVGLADLQKIRNAAKAKEDDHE